MKKVTKIVLTGGPCAGKSTAMDWIQKTFTERGYRVLFVPETATELITGGVTPWTCSSNRQYQTYQMRLQMVKEEIYTEAAASMPEERILIVCDRGMMDNRAYMEKEDFQFVLAQMQQDEIAVRDGYDAVFHLMTAANGAEEVYAKHCSDNSARKETIEEAVDVDHRLIKAWTGHPYLRIIDNSTDFAGKMERLIAEILQYLQ